MEFKFEIQNIFAGQITVVACETSDSNSCLKIYDVESEKSSKSRRNWTYNTTQMANNAPMYKRMKMMKQQLEIVIDEMGVASAQAQNLRNPITSLVKLLDSNQQRLYIMRDIECSKIVIGILKVGVKGLFLCDKNSIHYETSPLCILDFYVHESKQRQGFGHILFDSMLKSENASPEKLAIDRPSSKLLSFLNKHYGLNGAISQANNYVVFPNFFDNLPDEKQKRKSTKQKKHNHNNANEGESSKQSQMQSDQIIRNQYVVQDGENFRQCDVSSSTSLDLNNSNSAAVNSKQNCDRFAERNKRGNMNWGVNDAMHSYREKLNDVEKSVTDMSFPSPITPVNVMLKNCHKWSQLQTSWNVLGVKPQDYTKLHNININDRSSGIIAGRPL